MIPVAAAAAHATSKQIDAPRNYAAAMLLPDAAEWKRTILEELQAMEDNEVSVCVPLLLDRPYKMSWIVNVRRKQATQSQICGARLFSGFWGRLQPSLFPSMQVGYTPHAACHRRA